MQGKDLNAEGAVKRAEGAEEGSGCSGYNRGLPAGELAEWLKAAVC